MPGSFYMHMHGQEKQVQSALYTAGFAIFTVLVIVILFFAFLAMRAG